MENRSSEQIKTQIDHVKYSRDVVHAYSPGIRRMLNLVLDYIPYCNRQFQKGEPVIWALTHASVCSIFYACGTIPAAITEIARLSEADSIEIAEKHFQVPNETCAMVKSDIGEFYKLRGKTANRIYYSSAACEPYQQAFELLKDYGYDTFVRDTGFRPQSNKDRLRQMKEYVRDEILKTGQWVWGKPIDKERLHNEQVRYNRVLDKINYILELRGRHNTYMGSLPTMLLITGNTHYYGRPEEYEQTLDELIDELESLPKGAYNDAKAILGWSGSRGQEFNIFESIDEAGGSILAWNLPNDLNTKFNTAIDPIDACVEYDVGDFRSGTTDQVCQEYLKLVNHFNAKGVILYTYLGCSFMTIDLEMKRKFFQGHDIPGLTLLGAFDVGSISGQVSTRIRAFVEMVSKRQSQEQDIKSQREQAG